MTAKLGSLADAAASALGTKLDGNALAAVATWLARLEAWNARMDLTAARSPEELVDLMLADALLLAPRIATGATVVDVGTGAGAPGLALALLRPDLRVTLVEPLGKRASFLRTVIGEVGRADVVIERARGDVIAKRNNLYDNAVSRATLSPQAWLELGTRLTLRGGTVWVLLANDDPPSHAKASLEIDFSYAWPLTDAPRRAVGYRVL